MSNQLSHVGPIQHVDLNVPRQIATPKTDNQTGYVFEKKKKQQNNKIKKQTKTKQTKKKSSMTSLFPNESVGGRSSSRYDIEFRAGRMHREGNLVKPDVRKGLVYIHKAVRTLINELFNTK